MNSQISLQVPPSSYSPICPESIRYIVIIWLKSSAKFELFGLKLLKYHQNRRYSDGDYPLSESYSHG